ncbi:MAG: hypothetical protein IJD75_07815 [Clostridia bacterium]|nr:hypothetical protein [Clostridia bacterium]
MSNGHNMRVFWRVVKWSISLLLVLICGILIWRMCSSGDPEQVKYLMGNEALYEAYEKHGDDLVLQYQNQDTITTAERNRGYFSVTQYVFIPEAKQVQLVFRYNNSTIKHLAEDYGLAAVPDKSEELFDVTLVTTTDLTSDNRDDNANTDALEMKRYTPSAATRAETSLYTYYRFVFDNIEITPDMLYVFADIYYEGDLNYEEPAYGTLCLYDDESPWVTYKLSRTERKMLEKKEDE